MSSDLVGQFFKSFWTDLLIDVSPPYSVFGQIIRNNEAVFWGASGEFTRIHRDGSLIRSGGHSLGKRYFFKLVGGQIPVLVGSIDPVKGEVRMNGANTCGGIHNRGLQDLHGVKGTL